jgi:hypothetical protein
MSAKKQPQELAEEPSREERPAAQLRQPTEMRPYVLPAEIPVSTGRPKGARNRLTTQFFQDMLKDWEMHGAVALANFRADRPHEYVKMVAGLVPRHLNVKVNELDELSDEQINHQFNLLVAQLAAGAADAGAGDGAEEAAEPPGDLPALP